MASFGREDLEILQAQARSWLEATLHEPLPGDIELSVILADGTILKQVAEKIRRLQDIAARGGEPSSAENLSPASTPQSRNGGGKSWLRFSNVEKFLKMCRDIGLADLDLFTPTDVVQEKDIKRVCLCLRAVSRKARAMHLEIPDFDPDHKGHKRLHSTGIIETAKKDILEHTSLPAKSQSMQIGKVALPEFTRESEAHMSHQHQATPQPNRSTDTASCTPDPTSKPPPRVTRAAAPSGSNLEATARTNQDPKKHHSVEPTEEVSSTDNKQGANESHARPRSLPLGAAAVCGVMLAVFITRRRRRQYEVKEGDTLSHIARRRGQSTWTSIHDKNPDIRDPNLIFPGQKLKVSQ